MFTFLFLVYWCVFVCGKGAVYHQRNRWHDNSKVCPSTCSCVFRERWRLPPEASKLLCFRQLLPSCYPFRLQCGFQIPASALLAECSVSVYWLHNGVMWIYCNVHTLLTDGHTDTNHRFYCKYRNIEIKLCAMGSPNLHAAISFNSQGRSSRSDVTKM